MIQESPQSPYVPSPDPITEIDELLGALAKSKRRRILAELRDGRRCVSEIAKRLQYAVPDVSKHMTLLEERGLVVNRSEKKFRFKQLAPGISIEILGGAICFQITATCGGTLALQYPLSPAASRHLQIEIKPSHVANGAAAHAKPPRKRARKTKSGNHSGT